ncbi:MAG: TRAP transporter small permease [Clostridiales Family XIII bacterium]|jgi:TRAP-type C4-dicarboxylate transport system permease small subunit|nr:TRAP transporter small permease [Clostridiales Family XIII bacterium]
MAYPEFLRKLNAALGKIGGVLCFGVAAMFLLEAILRYVFRSPTSFLTDYACYLHALALFLGCAYTFQERGHVGVDLFRKMVDKRGGAKGDGKRLGVRAMAVIGYLQTLFFIGLLAYATVDMCRRTYKFGSMTEATYPIPQFWLYLIMSIGCILMLVVIVFILLSLFTKSETYVE